MPGFIAQVWTVLGVRDLTTPAVASFLATFGTIGLLGGVVAALKGRTQGLLAALFLAATPSFIADGASECADVPISFFILATLALLTLQDRAWPGRRCLTLLAGICASMAAWTKNEGLLLVALVVPIRVIVTWRCRGGQAAGEQLAWLAAGLAPVLALVLLFKFTLATSNANLGDRPAGALLSLLTDSHRWRVVFVKLAKSIVPFGLPVGIPLILTAYVVLVGVDFKTDHVSQLTGLALLPMLLAGYCVVCVVSPYDIGWQVDTALARLLLQLWPTTVFMTFLAANQRQTNSVVPLGQS